MNPLTYDAIIAELFPRLTGGIHWGLERTRRLLASVGDPQHALRVIHVGGTNGKGSVAAHAESVLRCAGHRTGLYSSPHLCTFRERIRIDGEAIGEAALLRAAERLWPAVRREEPSFFEATTALSFLALVEAGVEVAVVEVGLGGRLDSTNVVNPEVVVLTNVSLDHVQLLGPTIDAVAREKAGIIKPGVPVVTGEVEGIAADVFGAAAAAVNAPMRRVSAAEVRDVSASMGGTAFTVTATGWGELQLRTPLAGRHQALNAALAVHALDVATALRPDAESVTAGIGGVRWPGRLQVEHVGGVTWVFDVAHNVAGVESLVEALRDLPFPRPRIAVVGVLGDKDWANMLAPLHGAVDRVILTDPPTAPSERKWDPSSALAAAPSDRAAIERNFTRALERARAQALGGEGGDPAGGAGSVLVTGSFHTVGDALSALGLCVDGSDVVVERLRW